MVVIADGRGAGQDAHGQAAQLRLHPGDPVLRRLAVDLRRVAQQGPAELAVQIHQGHPGPRPGGGEGGGQPRRSRPHHQHVAEGGAALIAVRIGQMRRTAKSGGGTDHMLVQLPQGRRTQEGLVVEARRNERGDQLVHRPQVEGQGGPAVLALRHQAVIEEQVRGAGVGLEPPALAGTHQGAGLLHPGGQQAPGTVVLEAAAEHADAAGQQGGGQGVAGMAGVVAAVEAEAQGLAAVDQPAGGKPLPAAHAPTPTGRTSVMAWVAVSRVRVIQDRQP